ncbi:MAG TPA: methionine biosynthesis protein MetW [Opitutaceae bacterium]|jgi:methionine biosynthesis protein MetW|nr:methionine biosynthesis protein MetW [Opitutaceae bacterium]
MSAPRPRVEKRTVDMQVIGEWVELRARVCDLGCGPGALLDYLAQQKHVSGVGVDRDIERITACVRRGVTAYQGDMLEFLRSFPDGHFDRVICSRTVHELAEPAAVILEALRAGRHVTVGFVNHGYWKNRLSALFLGRKVRNAVYTTAWHESRPANNLTVADFREFCASQGIKIARRVHLLGDWRSRCPFWPNLLAGYALYDLTR